MNETHQQTISHEELLMHWQQLLHYYILHKQLPAKSKHFI